MSDKQLNLKKQTVERVRDIRYSVPDEPLFENNPIEFEVTRKRRFRTLSFIVVFIAVTMAVFSSQVIYSNQSGASWVDKIPIIGTLKNLAESASKKLKGEDRDRINILLLGIGGANHDGAYLTDTIMVASLIPSTKKAGLFSIPRDMTVPIEGMGWRKINSVDSYAEQKEAGSGGLAVSQTLNDVLNIPVDYYLRVDFNGFSKLIDEVGGINVYVDNTLDDYAYPIEGREDAEPYESRFEHLHIDKGWQTMDGSFALKYVRSRHAFGVEGSDFARAKRQQKVIEAVKEKLLSADMIFKPRVITDIIETLRDNISTNLKVWEIIRLWDMFKDVKKEDIVNKVLDDGPDGLLVDSRGDDGAFILVPRSGDFAEIQYYFNNIFTEAPIEVKEKVVVEKSTVEVRNGTWINGLASRVAFDLERYGFSITRIANANQQNYQKSVIYDLTYGEKADSLRTLKDKTDANVSLEMPDWLVESLRVDREKGKTYTKPDFILVLGQDADASQSGSVNKNDN